jgi:OOP family OmpA-OmpF porin
MKQGKSRLGAAKKIPLTMAAVCASLMLATPAMAQDNRRDSGPYVGASYGLYKSRGGDFEDENDLYEIHAGYRFNSFFGLEANYTNFGEYGGDIASAEVDGWGVAAVGYLPLGRNFTLYAKAGQLFSTVDVEVAGFDDRFDDEQIFYGLGVSFALSDPLNLIVEYNRYKVEVDDSNWPVELDSSDTDIDTIKIGLRLTF